METKDDPEVQLVQKKILFKLKPKDETNNNIKPLLATDASSKQRSVVEYQSYPERWWLLASVVLLNLANYR